jgi:acetyltransferase-like isoleucine patch superfamily enzyme
MLTRFKRLLFLTTFVPRKIKQQIYKYYNRFLFSLAGVNFGKRMVVGTKITLKKYNGAEFILGDDFVYTSGDSINPISRNIRGCIFINTDAKLNIGNDVGISSACIWCDESITIGSHVRIGGDCIILDTDCHSLNYIERRQIESDRKGTRTKPVKIGDDVLIGARTMVLKGVTIGDRSVIGAGSIVTQDIPSDCIAVGNPCKIIRYVNGAKGTAN